jgi:hypothetical protein
MGKNEGNAPLILRSLNITITLTFSMLIYDAVFTFFVINEQCVA